MINKSYNLIKLFVDGEIDNPLDEIRGFLAHTRAQIDDDAMYFYDVAPNVISSYGGRPLEDTVAFYATHMMTIARSKNIEDDTLDFEEMRVTEFSMLHNGRKGILIAVPKVLKTDGVNDAKDLRDKLWIGMSYEKIVQLLGEPSNVNEGSEMLDGEGTIIAPDRTISYLNRMQYCYWSRPEARYFLNIMDGKLVKIHSIDPPILPD